MDRRGGSGAVHCMYMCEVSRSTGARGASGSCSRKQSSLPPPAANRGPSHKDALASKVLYIEVIQVSKSGTGAHVCGGGGVIWFTLVSEQPCRLVTAYLAWRAFIERKPSPIWLSPVKSMSLSPVCLSLLWLHFIACAGGRLSGELASRQQT